MLLLFGDVVVADAVVSVSISVTITAALAVSVGAVVAVGVAFADAVAVEACTAQQFKLSNKLNLTDGETFLTV